MFYKLTIRRSFLIIFVALVSSVSAWAEPFASLSEEFDAAFELEDQGQYLEAVTAFEAISRSNPDPQLRGFARYQVYDIKSNSLGSPDAVQVLEGIVADYSIDTPLGLLANLALADETHQQDLEAWCAQMDQIASRLGGTTIKQIIAGSGRRISSVAGWTTEDQRWALDLIYEGVINQLDAEATRKADALKVALYLRGAIRTPSTEKYTRELIDMFAYEATMKGQVYTNPEPVPDSGPPTASLVSPANHGSLRTGDTISLTCTDGDFAQAGLSFESLRLYIDGADVSEALDVLPSVDLSQVLVRGKKFEDVGVKYQLPSSLVPGVHHGVFTVQDKAGHETTVNFDFTVLTSGEESRTLMVSKDAILSQQNPHRNEGANSLLQLSHRPEEKNKSNNPIVAFDLTNVNLTGLTKATLILNIQECEQPKKWGPEGREILAYPVTQAWVEGNGETLKVGQGEKTRGSGQGVTWFSPVDENIANKVPNGALQWVGARSFLGPLTAPGVRVMNRQTGSISFDVTQDVKAGFREGWLIRKQDESAFGNIRFFSKEGGDSTSAPRLLLEYNSQTAMSRSDRALLAVGEFLGGPFGSPSLKATSGDFEGSGQLKRILRNSPKSAYLAEQMLLGFVPTHPVAQLGVRAVYRSWLRGSPSLV